MGDNADTDDDGDGWLDVQEIQCSSVGGSGDKGVSTEMPFDLDGDGSCDALDPDDDGDGYPDPICVNNGTVSNLEYVACAVGDEDRFPRDATEWYDGDSNGKGDNEFPPEEGLPGFGLALALSALAVASVFRRPLRD